MPVFLVGTESGVHRVAAGAGSIDQALNGHHVGAMARDDGVWWAVADGRSILRSVDPAGAWEEVAVVDGLRSNCVAPTSAGLLVGTSEAHVLRVAGGIAEPLTAFDDAPTRPEWHTPWGGPPDVRSIAIDPRGSIHANVHVGGIIRSSDAGATWEPTIDLHSDVHQVLFDPSSGLVLAATAFGLAWSSDDGRTWAFGSDGLHSDYCRAVAIAGDTILLTASTGPRTRQAAVYRRSVNAPGAAFERCSDGLPEWFGSNVDTFCLAADGTTAAIAADGALYVSEDAGATWALAAEGLPAIRCLALA